MELRGKNDFPLFLPRFMKFSWIIISQLVACGRIIRYFEWLLLKMLSNFITTSVGEDLLSSSNIAFPEVPPLCRLFVTENCVQFQLYFWIPQRAPSILVHLLNYGDLSFFWHKLFSFSMIYEKPHSHFQSIYIQEIYLSIFSIIKVKFCSQIFFS